MSCIRMVLALEDSMEVALAQCMEEALARCNQPDRDEWLESRRLELASSQRRSWQLERIPFRQLGLQLWPSYTRSWRMALESQRLWLAPCRHSSHMEQPSWHTLGRTPSRSMACRLGISLEHGLEPWLSWRLGLSRIVQQHMELVCRMELELAFHSTFCR